MTLVFTSLLMCFGNEFMWVHVYVCVCVCMYACVCLSKVSCFGESGEGDNGDSWELQCVRKGEKKWTRGAAVKLKHANTQR